MGRQACITGVIFFALQSTLAVRTPHYNEHPERTAAKYQAKT